MATTTQPINLFEFEDAAKELLPKAEYDYIAGGATDEISVDRNRRAYASWAFRPRVLRDVSKLDLSTTVLGTRVELPVLIAPCGGHKRAHPEGELATYRAAASCGTVLAVSANANTSFEDLAKGRKRKLVGAALSVPRQSHDPRLARPRQGQRLQGDCRDSRFAVAAQARTQYSQSLSAHPRRQLSRRRRASRCAASSRQRCRFGSGGNLEGPRVDQSGDQLAGGRQGGHDWRGCRTLRRKSAPTA